MTFSNWPLYIEEDRGTLRDFEREYGTKVRYVAELANVERNLADRLRRPQLDAGREFSVPWQSGMTGLIYRKDKVKREPLAQRRNPADATVDDMLKAIERCERESASGQVLGA